MSEQFVFISVFEWILCYTSKRVNNVVGIGSLMTSTRKIVTTEQLIDLLAQGKTIKLPKVSIDEATLSSFSVDDVKKFQKTSDDNPIVSVEYIRDDEVQCISVDDVDHMYITDDFIPTHNTSNIVFLKSTDDTMIETLAKMSGEKHTVYTNSKTVTKDVGKLILSNDDRVSYTQSSEKETVISYNDMAFIPERNSIVFRAGDSPIWNRNQTIFPMSWIMFKNTISHPGHEYTLQTIPTLSSALDFDVRTNQPDFVKMLHKRIEQATVSKSAQEMYQEAYDLDDYQISMLDPDVYSNDIMEIIYDIINKRSEGMSEDEAEAMLYGSELTETSEDVEMVNRIAKNEKMIEEMQEPRYAGGELSRFDLITPDGSARMGYNSEILRSYRNSHNKMEQDHRFFSVGADGSLCSKDGQTVYISKPEINDSLEVINESMVEAGTQVYGDETIDKSELNMYNSFEVHPEFYIFLASLPSWDKIAGGKFDRDMEHFIKERNGSESSLLN